MPSRVVSRGEGRQGVHHHLSCSIYQLIVVYSGEEILPVLNWSSTARSGCPTIGSWSAWERSPEPAGFVQPFDRRGPRDRNFVGVVQTPPITHGVRGETVDPLDNPPSG